MRIGNLTITGRVLLAPMAGITDRVFRRLCRRFGAAVVYSEFLSTDGLIHNAFNQAHKLELAPDEHPVAYQLFGARTETFGRAAQLLADFGPDLIDLNFGCPVRKVVTHNGGASILRDLDLLERIVTETVSSVPLPVTIKMRAGWNRGMLVYREAAERAIRAGALAITLHARTREDGAWGPQYAGPADWSYITDLKRSVTDVPIIGNGDVVSPESAQQMLEQTGCDAVMVGRAAVGRPWIFAEINHYLDTGRWLPEPCASDRLSVAWMHVREKVEDSPFPEAVTIRSLRKPLAAYVKGMQGSHGLKSALMNAESLCEIRTLFAAHLESGTQPSSDHGDGWLDRYIDIDREWMPRDQAVLAD